MSFLKLFFTFINFLISNCYLIKLIFTKSLFIAKKFFTKSIQMAIYLKKIYQRNCANDKTNKTQKFHSNHLKEINLKYKDIDKPVRKSIFAMLFFDFFLKSI